jgi:hypothetical protein
MLRRRQAACRATIGVALLLSLSCPPPELLAAEPEPSAHFIQQAETLQYSVQWRVFNAGAATLRITPDGVAEHPRWRSRVHLESTGVIAEFFRLSDDYEVNLEDNFCALDSRLQALEGKRSRETRVTYDRAKGMASYVERDRVKNVVLHSAQTPIPDCVSDVVGGLYRLRALQLGVGQATHLPMSDGKKAAQVRIEAQSREEVVTKLGRFKTIHYEADLFNGVLYKRKAHVDFWLSDDARRLPVQIQVRLPIVIGTITLQLEKEAQG